VGSTHSLICVRLVSLLATFVRRKKIGHVYDSSMGFRLSPKILLSPDVSFVSNERFEQIMVAPEKFLYGAPDLAVEVLSPGDDLKIIEGKLDKYFEHGTRLAWVVDPKRASLTIHQPDSVVKLTRPANVLSGGEVLHGFKCRLSEILFD
jgi:Uma2 family endonuclease